MNRSVTAFLVATSMALGPVAAQAAQTADEKCLAGLLKAKGKYEKCVDAWLAKWYGGLRSVRGSHSTSHLYERLAKCRTKYDNDWTRLSTPGKLPGTACDQAERYEDNGDGTIIDHLTGLVWEKKSDDGGIHDRDDLYSSSTGSPSYNGDGTAYTTFLTTGLNTPGFAGASDWRLPTFAEVQTILLPGRFPCETLPCVPSVFDSGCTPGCAVTACSCTLPRPLRFGAYWSTTDYAPDLRAAWYVTFDGGYGSVDPKDDDHYVRAVRGGF